MLSYSDTVTVLLTFPIFLYLFVNRVKHWRPNGSYRPLLFPQWDIAVAYIAIRDTGFYRKQGYLLDFNQRLFAQCGAKSFMGFAKFGLPTLFTMDPVVIQAVLALHADCFGVEPFRGGTRDIFLGKGILTTDGNEWERSRKLLKPAFQRANVADLRSFRRHVEVLMRILEEREGQVTELQSLFTKLYLDFSTEFLLGESAGSLTEEHLGNRSDKQAVEKEQLLKQKQGKQTKIGNAKDFIESFNAAMAGVGLRLQRGRLKWLWEPFRTDPEWISACARTKEIVHSYVLQALAKSQKQQNEIREESRQNDEKDASNKSFVFAEELVKHTDDSVDIRDQITNVFFPARNSSATGLSNMFHLLSRSPGVWALLHSEILAHGYLDNDQQPTFELFKRMPYLRAVINEALRLHAPSPQTARSCIRDVTLPRGGGRDGLLPLHIRRGTYIQMETSSMHRDPDIWGEDAELFRPERWLERPAGGMWAQEDKIKPMWEYVPFAGGPRICPAQQMILTHYGQMLWSVVGRFHQCEAKGEPWREQHRVTVSSRDGVPVLLRSR